VASSGLFSGLEHGGRQMLGSNSQRLPDPEYGKNTKVDKQKVESKGVNHSTDGNKYA
jgi:hypothetical protein